MLKLVDKHTCRIFCSINHNGVWTTWIGIATIDMLGLNGLMDRRRERAKGGGGKKVDGKRGGLFCMKEAEDSPPQIPGNILHRGERRGGNNNYTAVFTCCVMGSCGGRIKYVLSEPEGIKVRRTIAFFLKPGPLRRRKLRTMLPSGWGVSILLLNTMKQERKKGIHSAGE